LGDVVTTPDGAVWFARGYAVGRMSADGVLSETAPLTVGIVADVAAAPDGAVWYSVPGVVGKISPDGMITEFPLPDSPQSAPQGLEPAADGGLWFTSGRYVDDNIYRGGIGRIAPDGGVSVTPLPVDGVTPQDLALGPDGTVWFGACRWNVASQACEQAAMGSLSGDGGVALAPLAEPTTDIRDLSFDAEGRLWFVDRAGATLNRYDLTTTAIAAALPLPAEAAPADLARLADGRWLMAGEGVFITADNGDPIPVAGLEIMSTQGIAATDDAIWVTAQTADGGFLIRTALP
jgi:virginiamycin B lyase